MVWKDYIPSKIKERYEVHDFKHAAAILSNEFPSEFKEICDALLRFRFTMSDVKEAGGNESQIPKKFAKLLRSIDWKERSLTAKIIVDESEISHDTHKVDFIKNRVAFDLEWNSKDQTFDRDLYAFRAFFEYDKISVGILVTRSDELDPWFHSLGEYVDKYGEKRKYSAKYGASTTHMGKLLPRLQAGRSGGCPVLVFGITTKLLQGKE
ncbi:MAG: hypothetical protein A3K22_02300 [Deltaproteobacteria bacterium RBG_16_42_7]|nr:MAG: hypothetical protein A3K22_02300 [Deltaproteobacteria bacterium RBG_16_42_7]